MKITGPVSAIIITIIISFSALFGMGAFERPNHKYATVNFENGFKRVGVIFSEQIFSYAEISNNGEKLTSGTFEEITKYLKEAAAESGGSPTLDLKEGVKVSAKSGIDWVASESSFRLTVEAFEEVSTKQNPINQADLIDKLEKTFKQVALSRKEVAQKALTYGPSPDTSFIIPRVLKLIDEFSTSF